MANELLGTLSADGMRFGIVVSRFNEQVTSQLLTGAREALLRFGARDDALDIAWVPGAFEIPVVARRMALSGRYAAVICLGALIRGETPHFEVLATSVAGAVQRAALDSGVPCAFGVLTTENVAQALARAGTAAGNKGAEAAAAAVETAALLRRLAQEP